LQRLHGVRLSAATVHKVLVQHGLSVLPTRNAHVTSRNATTGRCQVIACRWIRARSDPVYTNSPPSMIAAGSLSPA
jgi:hypothetical protein